MNHYKIDQIIISSFPKNNNKVHKNKVQQKEMNLTWINTQEVVLENKRNVEGSRNIHTKEEKTI